MIDKKYDVFIESDQRQIYEQKENRKNFEVFYLSERVTLEKILPKIKTVTDIGCLNGDVYGGIKKKYNISYLGIDIDEQALNDARRKYPDARFIQGDFMDKRFAPPPKRSSYCI